LVSELVQVVVKIMNKLNAIALGNTFALIDLILHPLFHLWVFLSPGSYEWVMHLFVAGLQLNITNLDTSIPHILLGTLAEAAAFWLLGYVGGSLYNKLSKI